MSSHRFELRDECLSSQGVCHTECILHCCVLELMLSLRCNFSAEERRTE